jgi:hypothetical protein
MGRLDSLEESGELGLLTGQVGQDLLEALDERELAVLA